MATAGPALPKRATPDGSWPYLSWPGLTVQVDLAGAADGWIGGVATFELYRVSPGGRVVGYLTVAGVAELVLPAGSGAGLAPVRTGPGATQLTPQGAPGGGCGAARLLRGPRGGVGCAPAAPLAAPGAGAGYTDLAPLTAALTGAASPRMAQGWTSGGLAWPARAQPTADYPTGMWSLGIAQPVTRGVTAAGGGIGGAAPGLTRARGGSASDRGSGGA